MDKEIFDELIKYQKSVIRLPGQEKVRIELKYDFFQYFNALIACDYKPLEKKANVIEVNIPNPVYNWSDYAREVVLFAKRRGDTIITSDKKFLKISYL